MLPKELELAVEVTTSAANSNSFHISSANTTLMVMADDIIGSRGAWVALVGVGVVLVALVLLIAVVSSCPPHFLEGCTYLVNLAIFNLVFQIHT